MNASWNTIPAAQQAQILQALGLESLPEPSALSEVQRTILAGILGTEAAEEVITQAPLQSTLTSPQLPAPKVGHDWSSLMMLVAEIRLKVDEQQIKTSTEAIKHTRASNKTKNKEQLDALMKNLNELHEANKVSLASKIFGWLGVLAGLVLAALAIASVVLTGGGAALLIAPILGAVVASGAFAIQLAQELEVWDGFVDKLVEFSSGVREFFGAKPLSEDEMRLIVELVISATMMVLSLATGIGAGVAVAKALAQNGGKIAAKLAGELGVKIKDIKHVQIMAEMPGKLRTLNSVSLWGSMITSGVAVMSAGTSSYATYHNYEASQAQADAKEINAWIARLSQKMQEEVEELERIIHLLNNGLVDISDAMSGVAQSHQRMISHI